MSTNDALGRPVRNEPWRRLFSFDGLVERWVASVERAQSQRTARIAETFFVAVDPLVVKLDGDFTVTVKTDAIALVRTNTMTPLQ